MNRIRIGEQNIDDLNILQERVRPDDHPDLKGAMTIAATHNIVNKNNDKLLDELTTELIVIEAINSHNNIPNFCPRIHPKKRTVADTPFLQTLRLKVGARVMLTINLDVRDGLCNGSIGTLSNVIRDAHGEVKLCMVKFDNPEAGKDMRRCHPLLAKKYPGCTQIQKQLHKYSTAKKSSIKSNTAAVYQFALILAFSSTTHKCQGKTVRYPQKVAVDLRSIFGGGQNQAYVMLGRCEKLS